MEQAMETPQAEDIEAMKELKLEPSKQLNLEFDEGWKLYNDWIVEHWGENRLKESES